MQKFWKTHLLVKIPAPSKPEKQILLSVKTHRPMLHIVLNLPTVI